MRKTAINNDGRKRPLTEAQIDKHFQKKKNRKTRFYVLKDRKH